MEISNKVIIWQQAAYCDKEVSRGEVILEMMSVTQFKPENCMKILKSRLYDKIILSIFNKV
jgi:hypothetical protein